MFLNNLFKSLFSNKYDNLDYNYNKDIIPSLTEMEIKKLIKGFTIKKKINDKKGNTVYSRITLPKTQQNNGKISCFITLTCNKKRMSYHGIFYKNTGETMNYGIRNYKHLGKNELGYDDYKALGEKCYKGHCGLFNGNIK